MDERVIADILAVHADRINQGRRGAAVLRDVGAEQLSSLGPLMRLAERLQSTLTPVQPDPAFVRQLGRRLITTSSEGRKVMTARTRKVIVIVAAVLGSVVSLASAVGVIIYLIRHRTRARPGPAI